MESSKNYTINQIDIKQYLFEDVLDVGLQVINIRKVNLMLRYVERGISRSNLLSRFIQSLFASAQQDKVAQWKWFCSLLCYLLSFKHSLQANINIGNEGVAFSLINASGELMSGLYTEVI